MMIANVVIDPIPLDRLAGPHRGRMKEPNWLERGPAKSGAGIAQKIAIPTDFVDDPKTWVFEPHCAPNACPTARERRHGSGWMSIDSYAISQPLVVMNRSRRARPSQRKP